MTMLMYIDIFSFFFGPAVFQQVVYTESNQRQCYPGMKNNNEKHTRCNQYAVPNPGNTFFVKPDGKYDMWPVPE